MNLQAVLAQIAEAAESAGRQPGQVQLLAVSKTFDAAALMEARRAGQRAFGENYLQEALNKMAVIRSSDPASDVEWHFIGPIQSNKTRDIAENFDWVQSVDRLKIAQRLSQQRPAHLAPLNICLQVNISGEASKSGVAPAETLALAQAVAILPGLRLRGLMSIPAPQDDPVLQRLPFRATRELMASLQTSGLQLDTLSMGMSGDLAAAIAEGASMVRVGSAIFGKRHYD